MRRKSKGSIFRLLITSYVVFAILLVVSLIAALLLVVVLLTRGENIQGIDPFALVEAPESSQAALMTRMGAWAEGLDKDYNVIEIRGDKQDDAMGYSSDDLFKLLNFENANESDTLYRGFLSQREDGDAGEYWLIKIPRDSLAIQMSFSITQDSSTNSDYFYILVLFFLFLFIVNCLLISLFLSRKIKKPLESINEGMERLRQGEQNVQLEPIRAQSELENIRLSFNYMSQRLYEEGQKREENETKKNQLLLDLSHDIKTPAATIKAYASALEEGLVAPEKQSDYLRTIDRKADRVGKLADDLFSVLSLEDSDYVLHRETVDIAELSRSLCAEIYDEAEGLGIKLEADIPDSKLLIECDRRLLIRVLENLLKNALKYNTLGKAIRVSVCREDSYGAVYVSDDGEAIPQASRDRIFDAFYRVDKTRSTSEGTGLGLAISKGIVERHGGSLSYSRQGNWNVFKVRLPFQA